MSVRLERQQPIYLPTHRGEKIAHPLDYSLLAKKNIYLMTHPQEQAAYQKMFEDELLALQKSSDKIQYERKIEDLTTQITAAQCIIDTLTPKNFISRIVFAILSFIGIKSRL